MLSKMDRVWAKQLLADAAHGGGESLLAHVKDFLEDEEVVAFLRRFRPTYIRKLRFQAPATGNPPEPKGTTIRLHLPPLPGETQLRASYEIALEGFLDHLEEKGYPVLLRREGWVEVYQPQGKDLRASLEEEWQNYLEKAFSPEGLSRSLLPLLNSVKLAKGQGGFGVPKVPVPTLGARDFLASWYLANLITVKERLAKRQVEIQQLESKLQALEEKLNTVPEGRGRPDIERAKKRLDELKRSQEQELQKYNKKLKELKVKKRVSLLPRGEGVDVMKLLDLLDPKNGSSLKSVKRLGPYLQRFSQTARQQLDTKRADIFFNIYEEVLCLLKLKKPEVRVPPLVSLSPVPFSTRPPGDRVSACYGCGRPLEKDGYNATKLVFSAPSQRLQSGSRQEEPKVCPTCAALSLLSPLKPGQGSILVQIGDYESREAARHFARLVATGTLHVAAGRYILLNSPRAQGEPLAQALGRLVYAVYALSRQVNPTILGRFPIYLIEGSQMIPLSKTALWLAHVLQAVFRPEAVEGGKVNRDLGEALQYALADRPWHALYVLARRYQEKDPYELQKGLEIYAVFLAEGHMQRPGNGSNLAERFKDVAGFIGILYAWASRVNNKVQGSDQKKRRALSKLLDNLNRPSDFLYTASYEVDETTARLYEGKASFFYGQAKRLLEASSVLVHEYEDENGKYLEIPQDALYRVYAHLAERYPDWDAFTYEVKLGLAARFPQYIRMVKEE